MAEISSPITSGIRAVRSSVSSRAFASNIGPDPATTSLLSNNQLALSAITSQLGGLSQQMQNLSASLNQISVAIANDSTLQRQRDIQEASQERILSEQRLREGKESVVERKIQNALVVPVQKISQKAQFTLSKLMGFFTTLLGGWLINQGIQTIQAYAKRSTAQLEQIRDNVLKNLGVIGGIYLSVKTGLFGLIGIAKRITGKITEGIFKGTFVRPFKAALDLLKKTGKGITNAAQSAAAAPTAALKPFLPPVIAGAIDAGADVATGEDPGRAVAGTTGAFATAAAGARLGSMVFGPVGGLVGGLTGYFMGKPLAKGAYDYITGNKDNNITSQPTTKMTPSTQDLTLNPESKEQDTTNGSKQDFSQPAQYGETQINAQGEKSSQEKSAAQNIAPSSETKSSESIQAVISPSPFSQLSQTNNQNIGPLPEPSPIIVPSPFVAPPPAAPSGPSGSSRPASYVPTFATSNPDNFYTLYSQVHYNVVM